MRITIKAQMPVIPVVSRIWVDFDAMLDNLETLNFRAFEKGLLTDTEQVKFNDTIERLRKEMREFWMEELKEHRTCKEAIKEQSIPLMYEGSSQVSGDSARITRPDYKAAVCMMMKPETYKNTACLHSKPSMQ